jgi:hypothetical protein
MPALQDPAAHTAANNLVSKLGKEQGSVALLAIIISAWQRMVLLYMESEDRHSANVNAASSYLKALSAEMDRVGTLVNTSDTQLKALHGAVLAKLQSASDDIKKAQTAMSDVLQVYADFAGTTAQLKQGLGALVKSTLTMIQPAIGIWAAPLVDQALS